MACNSLSAVRAGWLAAVLAAASAVGPTAYGQQQPLPAPAGGNVKFRVRGASERLEMVANTSRIVEFDFDVPRMLVNNPDMVLAVPLSPSSIQLSARKPGVTQVNVFNAAGDVTSLDIVVLGDVRELEMILRAEFPDASLRLRPLNSSLYISGFVPKADMVGQIVRVAEDYFPKVVNNMSVGGVQKVLLHVKVMEVSRTKLRTLGFDWTNINGDDFVSQGVAGLLNAAAAGGAAGGLAGVAPGSSTVRFGIVDGNNQFYGFLEALRQNNLAKLLSEPTLTTMSGRPASFNVGGEVPIPLSQALGTVTVEYKEFGTQVDFVPIVLGNGNIRLEVRSQVTEIDPSLRDAVTGVPGFRQRRADTGVEMRAGQTLAIAGLVFNRVEAETRGLPWLADLPWVGAAFRRNSETNNEVELVITVRPEFAEAMDPHETPPCGPGQLTTSPTDTELYLRGYIEVPRCCEDGSCPKCRASGAGPVNAPQGHYPQNPHGYGQMQRPAPVVSTPRGQLQPQAQARPALPPGAPSGAVGTGTLPAAQGASYAAYGQASGTSRLPTSAPDAYNRQRPTTAARSQPNSAPGRAPALIGPLGYDELK